MRNFLVLIFLSPALAFASETGPINSHEIQVDPYVGYSSYSGFNLGIHMNYRYRLDSHWQLETGLGQYYSKRRSMRDYNLGALYNFNEDWSRSWFVGGGIGLSEGRKIDIWNGDDRYQSHVYAYARAGHRFRMNESGTLTWNPYVEAAASDFKKGSIGIVPLSFGFSF